ncbi:hypothetical protein LCGC14_0905650 [marine sediment metagenome]|uniref:Uncharacterized protein n=1 Tax=marine sediment metagenome TaxID=412755 RepID=A0A0F9RE63_9ZZZZ
MILDAACGPLVMSTLLVWDEHDVLVSNVIWLNPCAMMASAKIGSTPERIRVGRFCFQVFSNETADQLEWLLPPSLHHKIKMVK